MVTFINCIWFERHCKGLFHSYIFSLRRQPGKNIIVNFSQSALPDVSPVKTDLIHLPRWLSSLSLSLLCFLHDLLFPSSVVCSVTDMTVTIPLSFPSSFFLPYRLSWPNNMSGFTTSLFLFHINLKPPFWWLVCSLPSTEHGISRFIFT